MSKKLACLLSVLDKQIIQLAFQEDLGENFTDLTSQLLFTQPEEKSAYIISKHSAPAVLCGLPIIHFVFENIFPACHYTANFNDGNIFLMGDTVLTLHGPAKDLLMAERTLLNFLQRLSAVATTTFQFVEKIKNTQLKILDTRKTTPGLRHLEKYAVACGGGCNHRQGLYDAVMIKDTHINLMGGLDAILARLPVREQRNYPVIIEIHSLTALMQVLDTGIAKVDRLLLDNMNLQDLSTCVHRVAGLLPLEASGNITLENIQAIAETGVDFASIGKLTHSATHVDLSMKTVL